MKTMQKDYHNYFLVLLSEKNPHFLQFSEFLDHIISRQEVQDVVNNSCHLLLLWKQITGNNSNAFVSYVDIEKFIVKEVIQTNNQQKWTQKCCKWTKTSLYHINTVNFPEIK